MWKSSILPLQKTLTCRRCFCVAGSRTWYKMLLCGSAAAEQSLSYTMTDWTTSTASLTARSTSWWSIRWTPPSLYLYTLKRLIEGKLHSLLFVSKNLVVPACCFHRYNFFSRLKKNLLLFCEKGIGNYPWPIITKFCDYEICHEYVWDITDIINKHSVSLKSWKNNCTL